MQLDQIPVEVIAPAGHILAETATWCSATAQLWWVDIRRPEVKRWDSRTGRIDHWPMPELAGAVVLATGGRVVVALRDRLVWLDPATGSITPLRTLEQGLPHNRLNEAKADRRGRLWCGSMWDFGEQTAGSLYRVDADGRASTVRTAVNIPNGIAFSPDDRTMYFVDTATGCIEAAPYDIGTGMPGVWAPLVIAGTAPGKSDGNTVDSDGCIWSARYGAGCVARFTPQGQLDRLIQLPASQTTSCTFGGPGLDTLFITTASQRLDAAALATQPLAGAVLAIRPGVRGLPEPVYAGTPEGAPHV